MPTKLTDELRSSLWNQGEDDRFRDLRVSHLSISYISLAGLTGLESTPPKYPGGKQHEGNEDHMHKHDSGDARQVVEEAAPHPHVSTPTMSLHRPNVGDFLHHRPHDAQAKERADNPHPRGNRALGRTILSPLILVFRHTDTNHLSYSACHHAANEQLLILICRAGNAPAEPPARAAVKQPRRQPCRRGKNCMASPDFKS